MTADTAQAEPTGPSRSDIDQTLRAILRDVLGLDQAQVDGVDGEMLESYGGLLAFAEAKVVGG